jgi:hypothetical protein
VFGVNVVNNAPNANLRDPATIQVIEGMLRSFGYEFFGSSMTNIGGIEWRQYNVKSTAGGQTATGVVRYGAHNGRVFGVSMLLSGGKEAAQDPELQAIASTFRFHAVVAAAPTPAAPAIAAAPALSPSPSPAEATAPNAEKPATDTASKDKVEGPDYTRLAIAGGVGLVLILIVLKLIGGGSAGPTNVRKR